MIISHRCVFNIRSKFNWELGCGQELVFILINLGELDPEYNVFDISANLNAQYKPDLLRYLQYVSVQWSFL